ncbi:MarR family winged helix-turn-helix transcriptional regulator [Pseudonocardia bannensis]|uniref:MarR family transcriptional regulator n=1 Tax=Pseudonocardia bannensis TaxID=630973 RepID=A0A848DBV0_9PSEU|nr:MarR family transcriptional regulator [Pseudonocardia bannensis]NMH90068.1 MarR family transcriptional regulator [Pseudonocardia bannensis]
MASSDPAFSAVLAILDLADQLVTAAVTPITAGLGISREQWRVLLLLAENSGATMGEVAARAGVPGPTATRIADRLVNGGLAYREVHPWDRRRVLVHLSADGREIVGQIDAAVDAALGEALARYELMLPPGTRDAVMSLLGRLTESAVQSELGPGTASQAPPGVAGSATGA